MKYTGSARAGYILSCSNGFSEVVLFLYDHVFVLATEDILHGK